MTRRRVGSLAARAALLAALWLLFVGKTDRAECAAALACGVAAVIADSLVRARTGAGIRLRLRWLGEVFAVPRAMFAGTWRLVATLATRVSGRGHEIPSRFRSLRFDLSGQHASVAGRCTLAILLANLSPDVVVLDITGEAPEGRLVYHQLGPSSLPRIARRLGKASS